MVVLKRIRLSIFAFLLLLTINLGSAASAFAATGSDLKIFPATVTVILRDQQQFTAASQRPRHHRCPVGCQRHRRWQPGPRHHLPRRHLYCPGRNPRLPHPGVSAQSRRRQCQQPAPYSPSSSIPTCPQRMIAGSRASPTQPPDSDVPTSPCNSSPMRLSPTPSSFSL